MSQPTEGINVAVLRGTLSSPPRIRTLASGDVLVQLEVTVRGPDGPAESVPVSWFPTRADHAELAEGDPVVVAGRVRRRFFRTAEAATRSATEVTADAVVPAGQRARARRAVERALRAVDLAPQP